MKRWPALDGLRGVAILLVILIHVAGGWFPSGRYGVTLFFVLSGFLITTLLLRELDSDGKVNFKRFYKRRAARLLPALITVSLAYLAIGGAWSDTWPALTYIANLELISGDHMHNMSHTWSLAVEEHFYLIWPVALYAIAKRQRVRILIGLLVVATTWRVWLIAGDASWDRIQLATDTSAVALLAGCLLATVRHTRALPAIRGGLSAIVLIVACSILVRPTKGEGYLWFDFLVIGASLVAIHAATFESRLLQWAPLRNLGVVSYGLYLWHGILVFESWPLGLASSVSLSLILTWLSWRAIEQPILNWARRPTAEEQLAHGRIEYEPVTAPTAIE